MTQPSETSLRNLVEALPLAIYELDGKGHIVYTNPAYARISGYSVAELMGMQVSDLMAPGPGRDEMPQRFLELARDTPTPFPIEAENRHRDGHAVFVRIHWDYRRDEAGQVVGFLCALEDVTEAVRAKQDLSASEERFRRMFEQAPFGTVTYGPGGKPRFVNQPQMALLGLTQDQMAFLMEHYNILEDEQLASLGLRPYIELGFSGEPTALPEVFYDPRAMDPPIDQDAKWLRGFVYPLKSVEGEVREVVVTLEDVTASKRVEEERNALEARLHQAQRHESLAVMAGGIAHDFNNLLEAVLGNADLVLHDMADDSPQRRALQDIVSGATRAADLVRQMLAYAGQSPIAREALDVSTLVEEVGHLVGATVTKKAALRFDLADDLPPVEADATQLRQIVMNLIINASESLGEGTGTVTLHTGVGDFDSKYLADTHLDDALPAGRYCYVEVSDTGLGMDDETVDRIFEPFFSTKFSGRGLGLAAVLGIVRGHGGAVRVESTPGEGTTFTVLIPEAVTQPEQSKAPRAPKGRWQGTGTILVVDDEAAVRNVAVRMLERIGFQTVTAADGRAGLDAVQEEPGRFAGVLLDLAMPEMDGAECLQGLWKIRPDLPVLVASGYGAREVESRLGDLLPSGIVQKPYKLATLTAALRAIIPDEPPIPGA